MAVTDSLAIRKGTYRLVVSRSERDVITVAVDSGQSGHAIHLDSGEVRFVARALSDLADGIRD